MRIINAYGYDVTGSEDILNEIETDLKNKQVTINWSNFIIMEIQNSLLQ